jgi:hypothetical protein
MSTATLTTTLPSIFTFSSVEGAYLGMVILPPNSKVTTELIAAGFQPGAAGNVVLGQTEFSRLAIFVATLRLTDPKDATYAPRLTSAKQVELEELTSSNRERLRKLGQQNTSGVGQGEVNPLDYPATIVDVSNYLGMFPVADIPLADFFRAFAYNLAIEFTAHCTGIAPRPRATIANVLTLALAPEAVELLKKLSALPLPQDEWDGVLTALRTDLQAFEPTETALRETAPYLALLRSRAGN